MKKALFLIMLLSLGLDSRSRADDRPEPVLDVFPDSQAPTFFEKESELFLQRHLQPWTRNSNWHPELDEKSVFHDKF